MVRLLKAVDQSEGGLANKRVLRRGVAVDQSEGVLVNSQCEGNTTKMGC